MYGNLLLTVTKSHERSGRPDMNRDTHHELKRGPTGRRSSKRTTLGLYLSRHESRRSPFPRKSSDMQKPIQRVHVTLKFETKIRRLDIFALVNLISAAPTLQKLEDRSQEEDRMARARYPRSSVEAGQKCIKIKGARKSNILLSFGKIGACLHQLLNLRNENLLSTPVASMHMISKKRLEWCWNGYFDEIVQSYDSHNRQWRSADAWRGNCVCQRVGYILDNESPRKHASSIVARKVLRWKRVIPYEWINGQKPHPSKNGIRIPCNTEIFVSYCAFRLVKFVLWIWLINFEDTSKTGGVITQHLLPARLRPLQ